MYFVACASPIYRHPAALHSENIYSQVSQELQGQISILSLSRLIVLCFKVQRKHALLIWHSKILFQSQLLHCSSD